jgi:thymidine kinase
VQRGRLEVICGPMFSGKTEELIRRLHRHEIAGRKYLVIKPTADDRYGDHIIQSHSGFSLPAYSLNNGELPPADVIGVDEVQLFEFPHEIENWIMGLVTVGKTVIAAGLDMTYRREPFQPLPNLLARAQSITKLTAVCHSCGNDFACFTQRLVNGDPAPFEGATILVGGLDTYEARCANCFQEA